MSSIRLYLSLTYTNIDSLWPFAYSPNYVRNRNSFCQLCQLRITDFLYECDSLMDAYLNDFALKCLPYENLRMRANRLKYLNKQHRSFIDEYLDIQKTLHYYTELNKRVGKSKAYKVINIINSAHLNECFIEYILNNLDGIDNDHIFNLINEITDVIKHECK